MSDESTVETPASSKPHWTSTPEGRAKLSKVIRRSWAVRRRKKAAAKPVRKPLLKTKPKAKPKAMARVELARLARIGAAQELIDLEKRITQLKLFLSV